MTVHRFDITHINGGVSTLYRCAGIEAGSCWGLARRLVEADVPDGPIEAGREGKVDWTFPSLHRFAVGAVSGREVAAQPDPLHPALRAAVQAARAAKAAAGGAA